MVGDIELVVVEEVAVVVEGVGVVRGMFGVAAEGGDLGSGEFVLFCGVRELRLEDREV